MTTIATAGIIRPEWQTVKIKYSFIEFEQAAHKRLVYPNDVAMLWNKFKTDAEIAANRIAREVMDGAIDAYLTQKGTDGMYDWLTDKSCIEP